MSDDLDFSFTDLSKFKQRAEVPPYPLVGIVGQQVMKKALMLAASNPAVGNIILIGEAGTGKSTASRGLRDILPIVDAVTGCSYNCDPKNKASLCQQCRESTEVKTVPARLPLLELQVGATEMRIFGGFDSRSRLKAGYVGMANRGYLVIPRANVLDQDTLLRILDISESGEHQIPRKEGAVTHPAKFNIIATMNPEDGELDQEVLDRFSMSVKVQSIRDIEERIEIVRRVEAYRHDPADFVKRNRRETEAFALRVKRARDLVNRVDMPRKVQDSVGKLLAKVGITDGRAAKAMEDAAKANAAFSDRVWVTLEDVAETGDLVLGHRRSS